MPPPLTTVHRYFYFSARLVGEVIDSADGPKERQRVLRLGLQLPFLGIDTSLQPPSPTKSQHGRAQQADRLLADLAVAGWDETAEYCKGTGEAIWGELRGTNGHSNVGMVGVLVDRPTRPQLYCMFGSVTNFFGRVTEVADSRAFGWVPSSGEAIRALLGLGAGSALEVDENAAFSALDLLDPRELAWNAANVVLGLGACGNYKDTDLYKSAHRRGYLVARGDVEWLARCYYWERDVSVHGNSYDVAVCAPLYLRNRSTQPLTMFPPGSGR